jgi:hypothetical protein
MPGLVAFGSEIEALQIVCFGFFLGFKVKVSRWNHPMSPNGVQSLASHISGSNGPIYPPMYVRHYQSNYLYPTA